MCVCGMLMTVKLNKSPRDQVPLPVISGTFCDMQFHDVSGIDMPVVSKSSSSVKGKAWTCLPI